MKFKATLSDRGLRVLERGFLPTLEKLGKRVQVLLGPDDVHLVQGVSDTDGLQVTARLANVSVCVGGGRQAAAAAPGAARGAALPWRTLMQPAACCLLACLDSTPRQHAPPPATAAAAGRAVGGGGVQVSEPLQQPDRVQPGHRPAAAGAAQRGGARRRRPRGEARDAGHTGRRCGCGCT